MYHLGITETIHENMEVIVVVFLAKPLWQLVMHKGLPLIVVPISP